MVTCAVPGCNSSKKENPQNYSFHIFPKNNDVRQKWLKMINREDWVPQKYSTICSRHFEQKCFSHRGSQRVKLRSGSIPTLSMPVSDQPSPSVSKEKKNEGASPTTPRERKLLIKLNDALQTIEKQRVRIKRLRYLNICKVRKMRNLMSIIDDLRKNSIPKTEQPESKPTMNLLEPKIESEIMSYPDVVD